ncbi:hypothetical protein EDB86DRAFT_3246524, partial [Lactarius hatsudake]
MSPSVSSVGRNWELVFSGQRGVVVELDVPRRALSWRPCLEDGNPHAPPQNQETAKLRGCKGWGGHRGNADTDVAQQGRKPGARRPPCGRAKYGEARIGLCDLREALSSPSQKKETGEEGPYVRPIHAWDVPRVMSAVRWTTGVLSTRLRIGVGKVVLGLFCGYEVPSFGQDDGDVVEQAESLGRHSSSFKWDLGGKRRDQIDPSHRRSDGNATTSVLQRVCETTDSPILYRIFRGKEKVKIDPSIDVGDNSTYLFMIGEHKFVVNPVLKILCSPIMKVMFFWTLAELSQEARKNSGFCNNSFDTSVEKRDWQTYHIAYNQRPQLDLKIFDDTCPDRNVPVIVEFAKYDQFRRDVQIHLEDFGSSDDN